MNNTVKEKILQKRKEVLFLEKAYKKVDHRKEGWDKWEKSLSEYEKAKFRFVCFCIKYRLPYEQIADLINISKSRIYQIYRYGVNGKLTPSERKRILDRDGNRCLICRIESKVKGDLHVHHV